jgi:hypothetical protein
MGLFSSIGSIVGSIVSPGIGSAIGGLLGGVGDSLVGGNAANNAAKDQASAAAAAGNATMAQYYQNRSDMMPWLNQGTAAVNKLGDYLGLSDNKTAEGYGSLAKSFTNSDFQQDPGYQFRLSEGEKALNRSMAAKGGTLSGAAAKALQRFNQDYATNEFDAAYNRFTQNQSNLYNRLAGLSGTGQTTANQVGNAGSSAVNTSNDYLTDAAAAKAAGGVSQANIWSTGLNSSINKLSDYF